MNAPRFNCMEALEQLAIVAGPDSAWGPYSIRVAYKWCDSTKPWMPPFTWFRREPSDGPAFYWAESEITNSRHFVPEIQRIIAQAKLASVDLKVMLGAALFRSSRESDQLEGVSRKLCDVSRIRCVAFDYDGWKTGPMPKEQKLRLLALKPFVVKTGSINSFQLYIPFSRPITLNDHARLSAAIRAEFNMDSKARPNDVLALAGTTNPKNGRPVEILRSARGATRDVFKYREVGVVAKRLSLTLPEADNNPFGPGLGFPPPLDRQLLDDVPTPTRRMLVRRAMARADASTGDLSRDNYFLVKMCAEARLTADQTYLFMTHCLPPDSYKFNGQRLMDDILAIFARKAAV